MLRMYDIIKKKRDGLELTPDEIRALIHEYTHDQIPDYQMAALTMAVFIRGLTDAELGVWTRAMMDSGRVMDLSHISSVKVDKHSTGGVGDKISLCLAPLVAACGVPVPMISGRGLGHTGGTLDKLESIPGFRVDLDPDQYAKIVGDIGLCLIGQTKDLAPADRKLYALRDVTGTVDSIPLISASIMCKKLAEGIDALVLDVKTGSGAFMKTEAEARVLASKMVAIGREMGREVEAFITDMDQPLGNTAGNALEVMEAVDVLKGVGPADTTEITYTLGAAMLRLGKVAADDAEGRRMIARAVADGSGLAKFKQMVAAQGGNPAAADDYSLLPGASGVEVLTAPRAGYVTGIDTEKMGIAILVLGAGRERFDSPIDHGVGAMFLKKKGAWVEKGEPLVNLLVNDRSRLAQSLQLAGEAFSIGDEPPVERPLVFGKITAADL